MSASETGGQIGGTIGNFLGEGMLMGGKIADAFKNGFPTPALNVHYLISQNKRYPSAEAREAAQNDWPDMSTVIDQEQGSTANLHAMNDLIQSQQMKMEKVTATIKSLQNKIAARNEQIEKRKTSGKGKKEISVRMKYSPAKGNTQVVTVAESDAPIMVQNVYPNISYTVAGYVKDEVNEARLNATHEYAQILNENQTVAAIRTDIANTAARLGWFKADLNLASDALSEMKATEARSSQSVSHATSEVTMTQETQRPGATGANMTQGTPMITAPTPMTPPVV